MELILPHINADFDALGSALAASKLYPQAKVVFPGSQERNVRDFLLQYPQVLPEVLTVRNMKKEKITRIILVDVSSPERLGELKSLLADSSLEVIHYDHHPQHDPGIKAQQQMIHLLGANTTMMVQLLREQPITISPLEATVYALGIYEETGNLTYTSTTFEDLTTAAYLLQCGADLSKIAEYVKRPLAFAQRALLQDLIKSRKTIIRQGIDISFALAEREEFVEDLAALASQIKEWENLSVLFLICRLGQRVYVVARSSRHEVNVREVLETLGGGGHATAASAVLKDTTMAKARKQLLEQLHAVMKAGPTAGTMMSSPPITVAADVEVKAARQLMLRFGHSGLLVVEDETLVGIITRDDLDQAWHHGLESNAVRHFMSTRMVTVPDETPMERVQQIMLEQRLRYLPVMQQNKLCGIITRADIMRYWLEKRPSTQRHSTPTDYWDDLSSSHNLAPVMREHLPERILSLLHTAGEQADQLGMPVYVVGGFVRDILLQAANWDVDMVVEGDGIAFAQKLARRLDSRVKTHSRFQTAILILPDGRKLDIATARTEYYAQPAALPQVEAASIKYDLYRRDFTINAMAIQLNADRFGKLVDYFGSLHDLRTGLIRVLYPMSFVDDPTRIFRAVRFEQRYGFHIEENTENYIRNALKLDLMRRLSMPRIFDELMLILAEDQPQNALRRLGDFGVLPWIHPNLPSSSKIVQSFNAVWEALAFAILFLDESIDQRLIYLMALLDPLSLVQVLALAKVCQFPWQTREALSVQKKIGDRALRRLERLKKIHPVQVVNCLRHLPLEAVLYIMTKGQRREVIQSIRHYLTHGRKVKPLLTGRDLKKMGYIPGPVFEKIFRALRNARLEERIVSRQDEIQLVRKKFPLGSNQK